MCLPDGHLVQIPHGEGHCEDSPHFIFTTNLEVYQLLAYAKNEQFSETIPTTEGNITLNLDAHEIAVLKFNMTITHCDHFSLDRFTIQNYRIDYKIKIDNSGIDLSGIKQYSLYYII